MTKKKRKIAVLTGKRGGFGALITLMEAIQEDPDMELHLIVTDMHLSNFFGKTINEVKKKFPKHYKIYLNQKDGSKKERSLALSRCAEGMSKILSKIKPDILVLLGDRGEVLSSAMVATELGIPIAHILGGDVVGNKDGSRIHAITKLSHLHFPSNKEAYNRIIELGEERWRVFSFGSTYIDILLEYKFYKDKENLQIREKYNIGLKEKYYICIQHPMTFKEGQSYKEMVSLLRVLRDLKIKTLIIYPCSDPGYEGIINAINKFSHIPYFQIYKNIEALDFWKLMSGCSLFIGNSSSGLMETPYFGVPSVNIGQRQDGRVRDNNVINTNADEKDILKAINIATSKNFKKSIKNHFLFGRGGAGLKIKEVLKNIEIGDKLIMKKITY